MSRKHVKQRELGGHRSRPTNSKPKKLELESLEPKPYTLNPKPLRIINPLGLSKLPNFHEP